MSTTNERLLELLRRAMYHEYQEGFAAGDQQGIERAAQAAEPVDDVLAQVIRSLQSDPLWLEKRDADLRRIVHAEGVLAGLTQAMTDPKLKQAYEDEKAEVAAKARRDGWLVGYQAAITVLEENHATAEVKLLLAKRDAQLMREASGEQSAQKSL